MENQLEITTVNIPYSPPASDNRWIYDAIQEKAQEGWLLKTRANRRRGDTQLTFVKPNIGEYKLEIQHERTRYTHPREKTNNRIRFIVEAMAADGWRLNARTNHEGFLSLNAHTRLMFVRPKGYKQQKKKNQKQSRQLRSNKAGSNPLFRPVRRFFRVLFAFVKLVLDIIGILLKAIIGFVLIVIVSLGFLGGLLFLILLFSNRPEVLCSVFGTC